MDDFDFDNIPAGDEEQEYLPPPPAVPTYNFDDEQVVVAAPQEMTVASAFDFVEPEEDALSKFHREWNKRLEDKRAKEFDYEKSSRQAASEELGSWKTQRDVRMNAKKDKNRTEEQVLLETFESETEMLKIWDRVSKLIDTTEAGDSKGSDTSRMRKLFIQLKNEPLESTRATN